MKNRSYSSIRVVTVNLLGLAGGKKKIRQKISYIKYWLYYRTEEKRDNVYDRKYWPLKRYHVGDTIGSIAKQCLH